MESVQEDPRVLKGKQLAELLWWSLAKRIVCLAGEEYKWTDEEWDEAGRIFLRANDYFVVVSN
jgi:hypothetical protein